MINLLANDRKTEITAARANVIILRYIGIIVLAILFTTAAFAVSYSVLTRTMASADSLIATNDVKADVYADTKKDVDMLSAQLGDAKAILDQEVRYSQVLVGIGKLMPKGTVLDSLQLSSQSFTGAPLTIKAYARSTTEASLLQNQLQSSPLFRQAALQSTETSGGLEGYPVVVTITLSLNKAGL